MEWEASDVELLEYPCEKKLKNACFLSQKMFEKNL